MELYPVTFEGNCFTLPEEAFSEIPQTFYPVGNGAAITLYSEAQFEDIKKKIESLPKGRDRDDLYLVFISLTRRSQVVNGEISLPPKLEGYLSEKEQIYLLKIADKILLVNRSSLYGEKMLKLNDKYEAELIELVGKLNLDQEGE